jgi:hypothetical protein
MLTYFGISDILIVSNELEVLKMKITDKYGEVVVNEDKGYSTMSGILNNYSVLNSDTVEIKGKEFTCINRNFKELVYVDGVNYDKLSIFVSKENPKHALYCTLNFLPKATWIRVDKKTAKKILIENARMKKEGVK